MSTTASWVEVRRCGRLTFSGHTCPFEGEVRVNQLDDLPAMWECPRCWRRHYGDAGRIEEPDDLDEVAW